MKMSLVGATVLFSMLVSSRLPGQKTPRGDSKHGGYLVESALMCIQCHSPRDREGHLIRSQLFMGAPIPIAPPSWAQNWALAAPRIAGLPGYTEESALTLLVNGIARDGDAPRRPMPPFRLLEQDARDVYAFLSAFQ